MKYVKVYKTKRYTTQKIYQYQKCIKLTLPLSSHPKSITPPEERHSILKFLPFFDMIVKGHKKPKDMTETNRKLT